MNSNSLLNSFSDLSTLFSVDARKPFVAANDRLDEVENQPSPFNQKLTILGKKPKIVTKALIAKTDNLAEKSQDCTKAVKKVIRLPSR